MKITSCIKAQSFAFVIIAIINSLAIMHGDTTLSTPFERRILSIPVYICTLYMIYLYITCKQIRESNKSIVVTILIYWLLVSFNTFHETNVTLSIFFDVVILALFSSFTIEAKTLSYKLFRKFIVIMSILGIIAYFSFVYNLGIPYKYVSYYGSSDISRMAYVNYGIAYITSGYDGIRLCGLFNEPGYYGTILALLLIGSKMDFSDRSNYILLIAGVLTLSFAFFVLIIIYLLLRMMKRPKNLIYIVFAGVIIIYFLPYLAKNNEGIEILFNRFTLNENGFMGNNRTTESFDIVYNNMFKNDDYIFGYGTGFVSYLKSGSLSYKCFILEQGIVGALIVWSLLFFSAIKYVMCNYWSKLYILCFFLSIYQRPYIFTTYYFLLLFGGLCYINYSNKQNYKLC